MASGGDLEATGSQPADSVGSGSLPSAFLRELANAPAVPPSAGDLCGRKLGRYRIERQIGRGGMGIVYAAIDQVLERPVALKVLPPHLVGDADRRRRLLREARSAARAAHGGIAAVYDIQEIDEHVVISMELVEGRTLRALLSEARGEGLPPAFVTRAGAQLAEALSHAHRAGVIHRDLKPENVMVMPGDRVKILDFGLARIRQDAGLASDLGTLSQEGRGAGTPCYMAPEQARGDRVDERADLFSLGVLLYELCTGRRPFGGASTAEVLRAVEHDDPPLPSEIAPHVPSRLEHVVVRCLRKRPEDRPASAADVVAALEMGPDSSEAVATSIQLGGAARKRPRRWAAWAAAGALAAAAGAAFLFAGQRRTSEPVAPPLASPSARLACPVLEASGVEGPPGWLGAAAASAACRRARALLGGDPARVLVPAELLDLPRLPDDGFPVDPYSAGDARSRTLSAARSRAAAFLDGSVARGRKGFVVHLALRDAAGRALAEGDGDAASLDVAVRAAMGPLVGPSALPRAAAVSADTATWGGVRDPGVLVALADWNIAAGMGSDVDAETARLAPHAAELGPLWADRMVWLATDFGGDWEGVHAPPLDRSSPAAFARSAPVYEMLTPGVDAAALAAEAQALADRERSEAGRAALRIAEARLRGSAGDHARAGTLLLAAAEHDPTSAALPLYQLHCEGSAWRHGARALAAWQPDVADAWNMLGIGRDLATGMARAHVLATREPVFTVHHAMMLVDEGRLEEARTLAAELMSSPRPGPGPGGALDIRLVAGELVLASIETREGRFGAAVERAQRVLFGLPAFGRSGTGEIYLLTLLLDLSALSDRAPALAERFVQAFVDPEPPRLVPDRYAPQFAAAACARAPEAAARRCFARLSALVAGGFFRQPLPPDAETFVAGAEALSRKDWTAAANAWRPMIGHAGLLGRHLLPVAFDRNGEAQLAERMDKWILERETLYHGISLAHPRAARRALAQGNRVRAEALARKVVDAWGVVDVPVPAVAEMQAILDGR